MRKYAEDTKVPVRQSLDDIEKLILKYGGSGIQVGTSESVIVIMFAGTDRRVRFTLNFGETSNDQRRRSMARAMLLAIKSKFVSIESGIETFEEAFLAQTVMPDGKTVIEHAGPLVIAAYRDGGQAPPLLPDYSS